MTKASDNAYPSILVTEGTEPSAPAAGKQRVYIDSTSHHLSRTDSSGTQVDLETNQSSGIEYPWHVSIIPMVWTPDATTGTWAINGNSGSGLVFPWYTPGSTANSGAAGIWDNSGAVAQNDACAWDVVLAAGTWDAHFWVLKAASNAIITLNQDGASQGTVDIYAAANAAAKVSITGWTVSATGKKRMQVLAATKNASSSNYNIRIFAIEFRRTA